MDIEPFYYMFISPGTGALHGFFHTYVGATIIGVVVAFVLIKLRKPTDSLMSRFKLDQTKITEKFIYISSIFAAYSHIFLDSFMHGDMKPFWPFTAVNPLLGLISVNSIYLITGCGLVSVVLVYLLRLSKIR